MSKLVTIPNPRSLAKEKELVLIPRREYELLLHLKSRVIPEVSLTLKQRLALTKSERELRSGSYLTLDELEHELGGARPKARR